MQECIYIPKDRKLREDIIREHHNSIVAGHLGRYKTQELITKNYWWPYIQADIRKYINGCETCQKPKAHQEKPHNPLHPHEIPKAPWEHILVDLIGELPESNSFNAILVITDILSKMIIIIPTNMDLMVYGMAWMYRDHVWSKHRVPRKVISDRGPQFVAQFMRDLHKLTGTTANLSTAYHPQMDGQTERVNQEVEQYLQIFVNHRQSDWNEWLSCVEFSFNNKAHTSTGFSPFYVNYGLHLNMGTNPRKEVKSQGAVDFAEKMKKVHEEAGAALSLMQETMKKYYDRSRQPAHEYQVGDKVWLEATNMNMDRLVKKLDDK